MKKLLLVFALAGAALSATAQIKNEVGIVVGTNLHYTTKDPTWTNYHAGLGMAAGLTFNHYFGQHSSVYVGAMYEHRKVTQTDIPYIDWGMVADKGKHTADYVMVPLMYRYTFGQKAIHPFVNAGPQIGLGFKRQSVYYSNTQDPIGNPWSYQSTDLELNLSAAVGAGVKFNIYKHFSLSAEFRQSFWLISDYQGSSTSISDDYATPYGTSYLLFTAAYGFTKVK